MTEQHEEPESGAITPAGRFARMEASLNRIEDKLDAKADSAVVDALELRVGFLEAHGSPEAMEALALAKAVQQHQNDVETGRSMSPVTASYLKKFEDMGRDIEVLKSAEATRLASAEATKETIKQTADARYSSLRNLVAIATIIQSTIIIVVTLLSVFHII